MSINKKHGLGRGLEALLGDDDLTFNISDIINSNKDPKYNPKLLSTDYKELKICDETENGYIYDEQKLNKKTFNFLFSEPLAPTYTKTYIRINTKNWQDDIYIEETKDNLTGVVTNNDTSLLMPTDAYQTMLANNKNYFIQNYVNRTVGLAQGVASAGIAIAGGIAAKNPLAIIGGGLALVNSFMNNAKSEVNEKLTIDNLKNAPAQIKGAVGDPVFNNMYTPNGIIVEEYDILPNEKEIINDYMCLFGFTYNKIDNIKNVDNIRKYYNYVRANVEIIKGSIPVSETVHKMFKKCFDNGIRFWNTDTFSYNNENYENWIDEWNQTDTTIKIQKTTIGPAQYSIIYNSETLVNDQQNDPYLFDGHYSGTILLHITLGNVDSFIDTWNITTDGTYTTSYDGINDILKIVYKDATNIEIEFAVNDDA